MSETTNLGWHVISGTFLLEVMRRCTAGEDADLVFAELWVNADHSPLCAQIGHDFSVLSDYHDEGVPLYECSRCGHVNA